MATFSKEDSSPGLIHRPANDMYNGNASLLKRRVIKEEIFPKSSCSLTTRDWREQEEQATIKCDRLCKTEENRSGYHSPEFLLNGQNSGDFDATEGRNEIYDKDGDPLVNPENDVMTAITCVYCNAVFANKNSLELHMRKLHDGKKVYDCSVCEKQFTHRSSRNIHLRVHTGQRPYECEICKKRFRVSSHLRDHVRTHTGERPFKCALCGRGFKQSSDMKKHRKTHYKTSIADGRNNTNYPTNEKDKEPATSYMIVRPNEVAAEHDNNPKGLRSPTDRPNNLKLVIKMERKLKDENAISPLSCDSGVDPTIESDNSTSPDNVPTEKQSHYQEPAKHTSAVTSGAWPTPSGMFGKRMLSNGLTFQEHEPIPSSVPNFFQPFGNKNMTENNQEKETNGVKLLNVQYLGKNHVRDPPPTKTHNGEVTTQSNVRDRTYADGGPTHDDDRRTYIDDRPTYTDDRPTYADDKPTYNGNISTYTNDRSTNTNDRPTNTNDRPTNTDNRPTNANDRPTNTNDRPTYTYDRPTNTNDRPTNTDDRPSMAYNGDIPTSVHSEQTNFSNFRQLESTEINALTEPSGTVVAGQQTAESTTHEEREIGNVNIQNGIQPMDVETATIPEGVDIANTSEHAVNGCAVDVVRSPVVVNLRNDNNSLKRTAIVPMRKQVQPTKKADRESNVQCATCLKRFRTVEVFSAHTCNDDSKSFKCNVCSKMFARATLLRQHMVLHQGSKRFKFKCNYCGRAFRHRSHLRDHERIHTGERPFKCSFCPKAFKQSSDLRKHENLHTGATRYRCEKCALDFKRCDALKKHAMLHADGEVKVIKCEKCLSFFATQEGPSAHTCQNKNRYRCQLCVQRFSNAASLRLHCHQDHTDQSNKTCLKCEFCKLELQSLDELELHLATHQLLKTHQCNHCDQRFSLISQLEEHVKLHAQNTQNSTQAPDEPFREPTYPTANQMEQFYEEVESTNQRTEESTHAHFREDEHNIVEVNTAAVPSAPVHSSSNKPARQKYNFVPSTYQSLVRSTSIHATYMNDSNSCRIPRLIKPKPMPNREYDRLRGRNDVGGDITRADPMNGDKRRTLSDGTENFGSRSDVVSETARVNPITGDTRRSLSENDVIGESSRVNPMTGDKRRLSERTENLGIRTDLPGETSRMNLIIGDKRRSSSDRGEYFGNRNDVAGETVRVNPMIGDKRQPSSDRTENLGNRNDIAGETVRVNPTPDDKRRLSDRSDERTTYGDKGKDMEENNAEKHFSKSLYHQEAKRKYTCLNCRLEFHKESTLVSHVCDLRSETLYQCLVCEKEFPSYEDLQGHMRIHWKPVVYFKCTLCGERVRNEELLKEHNLKHLCEFEEPGNEDPPGRPWTPDEQPRAFRNGERTTNLDTVTLTSGSVMATTVASYTTPVITSVSSDKAFLSKTTNRVQPRPSPPERGFAEHRPSEMVVEVTSPLTSPNQTAGNRERGLTTARSPRDKSSPGSVRTPYMTYFDSTKSVPGAYLNVFGQGSTMVVSAMHHAMDASGGYPMYYWSRGSDNHGS